MIYYLATLLFAILSCETNAATNRITSVISPIVYSPVSDQAIWSQVTRYSDAELNALPDTWKLDLLAPLPEINSYDLQVLAKKSNRAISHIEGPYISANIEIIYGQNHLIGEQPLFLIKGKYKGKGVFEFKYSQAGRKNLSGNVVKIKATNLVINRYINNTTLGIFLQNYIDRLTNNLTPSIITKLPSTKRKEASYPTIVFSSPPTSSSAPLPVIGGATPLWGGWYHRYYS